MEQDREVDSVHSASLSEGLDDLGLEEGPKSRLYKSAKDESLKVEEKPAIPSRQPLGPAQRKVMKSMASSSLSNIESISEEDVEIPSDGCLFSLDVDQMANFFRCLKISDHVVKHMRKKGVDGKKFSKFKDADLETLGIKNPVVVYFRDRSKKKRLPFML